MSTSTTTTINVTLTDSTDAQLVRAQKDLATVIYRCLASGSTELLAQARATRDEVENEISARAEAARTRINDCNGNPIAKGDKVTFFSNEHDGDVTGTVVGFRKGDTASTAGATAVIVDLTTPGSRTSVWSYACEIY